MVGKGKWMVHRLHTKVEGGLLITMRSVPSSNTEWHLNFLQSIRQITRLQCSGHQVKQYVVFRTKIPSCLELARVEKA